MLIKSLVGLENELLAGLLRKPLRIRLPDWSVRISVSATFRNTGIQEGATGAMSQKLTKI